MDARACAYVCVCVWVYWVHVSMYVMGIRKCARLYQKHKAAATAIVKNRVELVEWKIYHDLEVSRTSSRTCAVDSKTEQQQQQQS